MIATQSAFMTEIKKTELKPLQSALFTLLLATLLTGCGNIPNTNTDNIINNIAITPSTPPSKIKKSTFKAPEKLSDYGNKQFYTVKNKRYEVKPTHVGYSERGLASWYGKKFHNRLTSNREIFDMYKLTAAHKSLPLPSYVKVINLQNGRNVIVRVNDRGPFHHGRIIDLSYKAAEALDMVDAGVVSVEIKVVSAPAEQYRINKISYLQVAAYSRKENAYALVKKLKAKNLKAFVSRDEKRRTSIHRVRIGPLYRKIELEKVKMTLDRFGYRNYTVVN